MGMHGNAEILVYTMPVGNLSMELYEEYMGVLQSAAVIPISSLTRPGGYSAELSPFRSLSWESSQAIKYRFLDMNQVLHLPCEEVHASRRPLALLGICHCPTTENLREAYHHFTTVAAQFPTTIAHKCFAFEHAFGAGTLDDVAVLENLVMFPLAAPLSDGHTTVSLHLQVVLDSLTVTILMSLESSIRAAVRQHQQTGTAATTDQATADAQLGLLHTQVDPLQDGAASASIPLQALPVAATPGRTRSGSMVPSTTTASAPSSGGGTGLLGLLEKEPRGRRRMIMRQRKLMGDYSLLLGCFSDALEFYLSALDGLRDDERRASSSFSDTLWLAAALEGYVTSLVLLMAPPFPGDNTTNVKLNVEVIEKASEAIVLYAKAHCFGLEARLVSAIGEYYVAVHARLSTQKGTADEAIWVRQLALETHARLVVCFPSLSVDLRLQHLLEMAAQCGHLRYVRKQAFFLHEAASLLVYKHRLASPPKIADLRAALFLDQVALGLLDDATSWVHLRFLVLRQLVAIARICHASPDTMVSYALSLLQLLTALRRDTETATPTTKMPSNIWNDGFLEPFSSSTSETDRVPAPLHTKTQSVYYAPPPLYEKDVRKAMANASFFGVKHLPTTMAVATTPRLLSTPRQLMTAVLNVQTSFGVSDSAKENHRRTDVTDKSADAETPFLELHMDIDVALWQGACWALLQSDPVSRTRTVVPLLHRLLDVRSMTPLVPRPLVSAADVRRLLDPVAAKATFMYNPFQAKTTSATTVTTSFVYALGDLVGIEVEAANPLDIALVLPRLQAYCSGHMLAYPAAASLVPRQERSSVLLTLRPQAVGDLVLEGIDCVLPQQTLQYLLPRPVCLQVVDAIAVADWTGADRPATIFANEDRVLPISLRNASTAISLDDVTLLLSVHRQTDGFHAPAATMVAPDAPGRVAISDFAVAWDAVALDTNRRLPPQATLHLPLRIEAMRPDVVDVKLRALYRGRDPEWYRESTTVLRVHVRAGVSVLGAPSLNGIAVWNAADVPFRVHGAVIAPQSVMNVALPSPECQRLPWETTEGSASGTLLVPERPSVPEAPASIALTTDTRGAWQLGAFYEIRVATSIEYAANLELIVAVTVTDAMTNEPMSAATCLLAGALEYTVCDPIQVHVLQVAFLQTGQFRVTATGPADTMCASMTVHVVADDAFGHPHAVE